MTKKDFASQLANPYRPIFLWAVITGLIMSLPVSSGAATASPRSASEARLKALENRLQEIETARERLNAGTSGQKIRRSQSASRQLADRLSRMRVTYRRGGGTPCQIRGGVLEKAFTASGTVRERDEITARNFLNAARHLLRLEQPDSELTLRRYQADFMDRRHLRFSQTHEGIPVWPSEVNIHLSPDGDVDLMNGASAPTPTKMSTRPVLTASDAVKRIRTHFAENGEPSDDAEVTAGPDLIVYAPGDKPARLAWKTELTFSFDARWITVTDAMNGKVLTAYNRITSAGTGGSGTDLFGVRQSLSIWEENGLYYMVNTGKAMYNAAASDPPNPKTTVGGIVILDAENQPNTSDVKSIPPVEDVISQYPDSGWIPDAVSAAINFSETYDYYLERHNRNSVDGKGGSIHAVVRLGRDYNNAFWDSETRVMYFGDASPFAGALDVVAHELTHGVTSNTANLIYRNQSGALNEAFSDIFGEMTEARTNGAPDWVIGTMLSAPLRNLKDPGALSFRFGQSYPSKMSEYFSTTEDNGGVHINATIISHAFYLLAEGLNGAIGIRDAERIFYRALAFHLVPASRFADARLACIRSAEELFGEDSGQTLRTAEAFDAVEIFGDTAPPEEPGSEIPVVAGEDALLFVASDGLLGGHYLGRRESSDPVSGVRLSGRNVTPAKPSVSADGTLAVFVSQLRDFCMINTETGKEECMGWFDVSSVAMSPDASLFGFVFLGNDNAPSDSIAIFNMDNREPKVLELVAPGFSEGNISVNTILRADAMTFSSDNRYIIYDALNVLDLDDGSQIGAWSIYAIDLETDQTLVLVPPVSDLDIGFPALANTSDRILSYSAYDADTDKSTLYARNLDTGQVSVVGETGRFAIPSYTGDDRAIVYPKSDATSTGHSLCSSPCRRPADTRRRCLFIPFKRQLRGHLPACGCLAGAGCTGNTRSAPGQCNF